MQSRYKSFFQGLRIEIITGIIVLLMALAIGAVMGLKPKIGILLFGAIIGLSFLSIYRPTLMLAFICLTWWLPVGISTYTPYPASSTWLSELRSPEIIAYLGVALLILPSKHINYHTKITSTDYIVFISAGLLLFGGLIAAQGIKNPDGYATLRWSSVYLISVLFLFRFTLSNRKLVHQMLFFIMSTTLFIMPLLLVVYLFPGFMFQELPVTVSATRWWAAFNIPLVGSFYYGSNVVGSISSLLIVLSLTFILYGKSIRETIIGIIAFILNLITLLLSGHRTGWVAAVIGGGCMLLYSFPFIWKSKKILTILVMFLAIVAFILPFESSFQGNVFSNFLNRIELSSALHNLVYRYNLWRDVYRIFINNPFGIGYNTFQTSSLDTLSEHNLFLNIALGSGLLGLVGILNIMGILLWQCFRRISQENISTKYLYISCLAVNIVFLIVSFTEILNAQISVFFIWFPLGISYAAISLGKRSLNEYNHKR